VRQTPQRVFVHIQPKGERIMFITLKRWSPVAMSLTVLCLFTACDGEPSSQKSASDKNSSTLLASNDDKIDDNQIDIEPSQTSSGVSSSDNEESTNTNQSSTGGNPSQDGSVLPADDKPLVDDEDDPATTGEPSPESPSTVSSSAILDATDRSYLAPELDQDLVTIIREEDTKEAEAFYTQFSDLQDLSVEDLAHIFSPNIGLFTTLDGFEHENQYIYRAYDKLGLSVATAYLRRSEYYLASYGPEACEQSTKEADDFFANLGDTSYGCYCPRKKCLDDPTIVERVNRLSSGMCMSVCGRPRGYFGRAASAESIPERISSLGEQRFQFFKNCYRRMSIVRTGAAYEMSPVSCSFQLPDEKPTYTEVKYQRQLNDFRNETVIDSLRIEEISIHDVDPTQLGITDFSPLDNIEVIHGTLRIEVGSNDDLEGKVLLPRLKFADRIEIIGAATGTSLIGLGTETRARGEAVRVNNLIIGKHWTSSKRTGELKSIGGPADKPLESIGITEIGNQIRIYKNSDLERIELPFLQAAHRIRLEENTALTYLRMPQLHSAGKITMKKNEAYVLSVSGQEFPALKVLRGDAPSVPVTRDAAGLEQPSAGFEENPIGVGGLLGIDLSGALRLPALETLGMLRVYGYHTLTRIEMLSLTRMSGIYISITPNYPHYPLTIGEMGPPDQLIVLDEDYVVDQSTPDAVSDENWKSFLARLKFPPEEA